MPEQLVGGKAEELCQVGQQMRRWVLGLALVLAG